MGKDKVLHPTNVQRSGIKNIKQGPIEGPSPSLETLQPKSNFKKK